MVVDWSHRIFILKFECVSARVCLFASMLRTLSVRAAAVACLLLLLLCASCGVRGDDPDLCFMDSNNDGTIALRARSQHTRTHACEGDILCVIGSGFELRRQLRVQHIADDECDAVAAAGRFSARCARPPT